ncbi:MAG: class I SAM-dependent methyltransferase [Victivallaceae bacterium]|nr:class I SAM-dependent methyltransferase [Victivallaceae bacterium]
MIKKQLREIAGKIPLLPLVYRAVRDPYIRHKLKSRTAEKVFTDIYEKNSWAGDNSVSGTGSDLSQTGKIMTELSTLFRGLGISALLDVPCGDFYWMKELDLGGISYIGADIVRELVAENTTKYGRDGIRFQYLNLITDELPETDLIFCRDCLVHFSFADVFAALDNICRSRAEYLLTTTFTERKRNHDIATGQWSPRRLQLAPFSFPAPLKLITEDCREGNGIYADKALGLWKIADLRASLAQNPCSRSRTGVKA